jgi:hypothetical protein
LAEGEARAEVSPFPREPARAPSPAKFLARELRLGLAAKERNPSAFRQSQGRESEMVGRGLVSNRLKWPSWAWPAVRSPYQTRPNRIIQARAGQRSKATDAAGAGGALGDCDRQVFRMCTGARARNSSRVYRGASAVLLGQSARPWTTTTRHGSATTGQ